MTDYTICTKPPVTHFDSLKPNNSTLFFVDNYDAAPPKIRSVFHFVERNCHGRPTCTATMPNPFFITARFEEGSHDNKCAHQSTQYLTYINIITQCVGEIFYYIILKIGCNWT